MQSKRFVQFNSRMRNQLKADFFFLEMFSSSLNYPFCSMPPQVSHVFLHQINKWKKPWNKLENISFIRSVVLCCVGWSFYSSHSGLQNLKQSRHVNVLIPGTIALRSNQGSGNGSPSIHLSHTETSQFHLRKS